MDAGPPAPPDAGSTMGSSPLVPSRVWKGPATLVTVDGEPLAGRVESMGCGIDRCLIVVSGEPGVSTGLWLRRADGVPIGSIDLQGCHGPVASDGTGFVVLCGTGLLRVHPDGSTSKVEDGQAHAAVIHQDGAYLIADATPTPGGDEVSIARLDESEGLPVPTGCCGRTVMGAYAEGWTFSATEAGPALVDGSRVLRLSRSAAAVEDEIELLDGYGSWFGDAASVRGELLVLTEFFIFDAQGGELHQVDLDSSSARYLCPSFSEPDWRLLPVHDEYYVATRDRSLVRLDRRGRPVADDSVRELVGQWVLPLGPTRFVSFARDAEGRLQKWIVEYGEALPPIDAPVFPAPTDPLPISGEALAHEGDTVAMLVEDGEHFGGPEVEVWTPEADGWSAQAHLLLSASSACITYGEEGMTLALSGDTLVVGAPSERCGPDGLEGPDTGAVYVFVRTSDGWTRQAFLQSSNRAGLDRFGARVAIDGDLLVVGAPGEDSAATGVDGDPADDSAPERGAAYVFTREGGTWTERAYLKPSTDRARAFGDVLAVSGETIVVGSEPEEAAYVFVRVASRWVQQARLETDEALDAFGRSVAVWDDTIAVGAPEGYSPAVGVDLDGDGREDPRIRAGVIHVFARVGWGWDRRARLEPSSRDGFELGPRMSLEGDHLVTEERDGRSPARTRIIAFGRDAGLWSRRGQLDFSASGCSVQWSFSDPTLIVRACQERSLCGCNVPCFYRYALF